MSIYKWRFYINETFEHQRHRITKKKKLLKKVNISPLFKHVDILVRIRRTNIKRKIIRQRRRQTTKTQYTFNTLTMYVCIHICTRRSYSQAPNFIYDLLLNLIFLSYVSTIFFVSYSVMIMFMVMPVLET